MHLIPLSTICVISSLTLLARALPFLPQDVAMPIQKRIPYSVVAVDGGSAPAASATITVDVQTVMQTTKDMTTITAPPSTLPPSTEIIVSTKIVEESESEPATAVAVTITKETSISTLPSPSLPSPSVPSSTTVAMTTMSSSIVVVPFAPSQDASESATRLASTSPISESASMTTPEAPTTTQWVQSTLTVSPVPYKTTPTSFDDGQWHTYWNATSTTASTTFQAAYSTGHVSAGSWR